MADRTLDVYVRGHDNLTPALKHMESGVIRVVGAISSLITAVTAITYPIKAASDFQKQLLEVKKTTDLPVKSIEYLSGALVGLSRNLNISAVELAKIATLGGQLGIADLSGVQGLLEFTKEISTAVTALDVPAELAATALGKLINIFNIVPEKYRNTLSVINQLSNESTASAEEIFDVLRRIGDLGGSVRVEQATALAALAIDLGLTAETAGTSLTKIFTDMRAEASSFADFMGVSTQEWVDIVEKDGVEALRRFLVQLNRVPADVAAATQIQLAGGGRISNLLDKLRKQVELGGSSRFDQLLKSAYAEFQSGTSLIREQQDVLSGLDAQFKVFQNNFNATAIESGKKSLYGVVELLATLNKATSDPAFIDGLGNTLARLVGYIESVVKFISGLRIDWDSVFNIAALVLIKKTLTGLFVLGAGVGKSLGAAIAGNMAVANVAIKNTVALVSGLRKSVQQSSFSTSNFNFKSLPTKELTTGKNKEQQEISLNQKIVDSLNSFAVRRKQIADQIIATEEAKKARLDAIGKASNDALRVRLAEREAIDKKALLDTTRATYNAIRARGPDYSAAEALRNRVMVKYAADRAALEASHQARLSAIVGAGSKARKEQEIKDHADSLAILDRRLQATLNRQKQHYDKLIATADAFYAKQRALATGAVVDASIDSRNANAALKGAIDIKNANIHIANSSVAASSALLRFMSANRVLQPFVARTSSLLVILNRTLVIVGRAGSIAIRGLASAFGFLKLAISGVFNLFFVFELSKIVIELLGLEKQVTSFINSIISGINKITGLKIPKLLTDEQAQDQADAARLTLENYRKLIVEGELFDRKFGNTGASIDAAILSFEKFSKALVESIDNVRKLREALDKKITFNVDDVSSAPDAIKEIGEAYTIVASKVKALEAQQKSYQDKLKALADEQTKTVNTKNNSSASNKEREAATKRLIGLEQEIYEAGNLSLQSGEARNSLLKESRELLQSFAKGFGPDFWGEVLGGGNAAKSLLGQIQSLTDRLETLRKERERLGPSVAPETTADKRTAGALVEAKNVETELHAVESRLADLKNKLINTPSVASVLYDPKDRAAFADLLIKMNKASDVVGALGAVAVTTGKDTKEIFAGLATIPKSFGADINAAKTVFASNAAAAYREMANIAREKSEQAKNAVKTSISEQKKELQGLATFFKGILTQIRSAKDKAALQKTDKKLSESLTEEEFYINLDRKRDQRVNQAFIDKALADIDKSEQRRRYTAKEAEILRGQVDDFSDELNFRLNRSYDQRINELQDNKALSIAGDAISRQKIAFNDATTAANGYRDTLVEVIDKLRNPAISNAQKVGLIAEKETALTGLAAELDTAKGILQSIAGTDPIGGKLVVTDSELTGLKNAIAELTKFKAGVNIATAGTEQSIFSQQSTEFNAIAQQFEGVAKTAGQAFIAMRTEARASTARIAEDFARMAQSTAIKDMTTDVRNLSGAFTDITSDGKGFAAKMGEISKSLADAASKVPNFTRNKAEQENSQFKELVKDYEKKIAIKFNIPNLEEEISKASTGLKPTNLNGAFSSTQLNSALNEAEKGLEPVDIKGRLTIEKPDTSSSLFGTPGVQYRASGGPIFGSGGPTQDKVLAAISPTEWIIKSVSAMKAGWDVMARINAGLFDPELLRMAIYGGFDRLRIPSFAAGGSLMSMPIPSVQSVTVDNLGDNTRNMSVLNLHLGNDTVTTYVPSSQVESVRTVLDRAVLTRGSRKRN